MNDTERTVFKYCAIWMCGLTIFRAFVSLVGFLFAPQMAVTGGMKMPDWLLSVGGEIIKDIAVTAFFSVLTWFLLLRKIPKKVEDLQKTLKEFIEEEKKNKEAFSKTIKPSGDSLGKDHEKIVEIVSNVNGEIEEQKALRRNNAGSKIEKLDQDVQNAVREFADLKETVSKLQEQIQEFQQKNMHLQAENEKLNSQLQEMQSQGMDMA